MKRQANPAGTSPERRALRGLLLIFSVLTAACVGGPGGNERPDIVFPPFGGPGAELVHVPGRGGGLEVSGSRVWMMINPEGVDEGGASVIAIDPGAPGSDVVDAEVSLADHRIEYPAGYAVRGTSVWALGMTLMNGYWDEEPRFLVKIDVATGRELARTDVGRLPRDVIVAFGHVWVSNSADDTLLRLDPRSLDVVQTIETGDGPSRILAAFGSLWLETEYNTPTVQRIDPDTGTIIATIRGRRSADRRYGFDLGRWTRPAEQQRRDPGDRFAHQPSRRGRFPSRRRPRLRRGRSQRDMDREVVSGRCRRLVPLRGRGPADGILRLPLLRSRSEPAYGATTGRGGSNRRCSGVRQSLGTPLDQADRPSGSDPELTARA
jgi:hypothetical protein